MGSELWEIEVDFNAAIRTKHKWSKNNRERLPFVASRMDFIANNPDLPMTNIDDCSLRMAGKHQSDNAALAIAPSSTGVGWFVY